jgi:guanosine-3',5'-bis(diphosphate) 3'-pyrophosphohydrolase
MDDSVGLILKAITFAAEKHKDQRRKDFRASPYINHPIRVTEILWGVGDVRDMTLLVSAVLHDTIEDTNTTHDEIRTQFGEDVLALVLEVTDDKTLPKDTRKQLQIEHAPHISKDAKSLKLADKICNVTDLVHAPPTVWTKKRKQEYLLWTERVVAGLRGTNPKLESRYDEILNVGKRSLGME